MAIDVNDSTAPNLEYRNPKQITMTKWKISDFGFVSDFDIRISSLWNVFGITIAKEEWRFKKKSGKLAEQLTHFKKIMIGISFFGKVF